MSAFSGGDPAPDIPGPWEVFGNVLYYGCVALLTLTCAYAYRYSLKADKDVRKRCATGDVVSFGFIATLTVGYWITVFL